MDALVYYGGRWYEEEARILGPTDHAVWMSTVVFDGARAFDDCIPDLEPHCARLIDSARALMLEPSLPLADIVGLAVEAVRRFPRGTPLYIRPMFFARRGFVLPESDSTEFALVVHKRPLPEPSGQRVCFSSYRRPARDMAPTDSKASCLYPNMQRALAEALRRGFDNAVVFDPVGNVAELATANLWLVRDGVALTPAWNGTFLNGITRRRVIQLLRADGIEVREVAVTREDVLAADELFSTGNYGKVLPITQIEERELQPGPIFRRARELYWDFAHSQRLP